MNKIKMSDIAKAAGVSHATVARVIHKNGYVSEEARLKIERLIHETGYVPNKLAQGLKSSQSQLIGHLTVFNPNMLFAKISYAVSRSAAQQGFHVLTLTSHPRMDEEEAQLDELIGRRVDGIIITSNAFFPPALIQKLVDMNIPVVMIERTLDIPFVDRVRIDDLKGSQEATGHIIAKGHRRIGFIGRKPNLPVNDVEHLRFQGYLNACLEAKLTPNDELVRHMEEYSVEAGYQAAESLMKLSDPPSALFATSDLFIAGVLQYLQKHGRKVPADVSLVGYDDTLSALLAPPVTSVALSHEKMGEQAIQLLVQRTEDIKAPSRSVMIATVLIDRHSVAEIDQTR